MKNYLRENIERYRRMAGTGVPAGYDEFSSRGFLDEVIPRLDRYRQRPRVLELGTGIGPGAIYLAERGFAVHAVDLIPEAVAQARRIAAERGLDVCFEVMDVTRIPYQGPVYDLVVDSYCLQGIVLDVDREAVFGAVQARLHPRGCYLVSSAMYATGATGRWSTRGWAAYSTATTKRACSTRPRTSTTGPTTASNGSTARSTSTGQVLPVPPLPHRPPTAR